MTPSRPGFFCRQTGHCGQGMVFAVNCGANGSQNSFTNFKNAALAQGAAAASSAAYPGYSATPTATASGGATPSATAGPQVHTVIVGGANGEVFTPSSITAQPNDIVTFEFQQKNHTVTQSSFASPCSRLNVNGTTGFDSGFFPVAANATQFPTWNFTVQDTKPVWAYCRQVSHCQSGMVFAINAVDNSPANFTAFLNNAKSSATNASTTSASTSSPTQSSSAVSTHLGGTSVTLMVVALLFLVL